MEKLNAEALSVMISQHGVKLREFPQRLVEAARGQARDVLAELASRDAASRKIHDSYMDFRAKVGAWSRVSLEKVLGARG
jgi:TRAP-type mannitol/chloroaromatic compound transport system substrate-binding protein